MNEEIILTDNGKVVLAFMQNNDQTLIGKEIGELTNIKGIYSVLTSLIRRELVCADQPVQKPFTNNKGVETMKEYKTYKLTEKGKQFKI